VAFGKEATLMEKQEAELEWRRRKKELFRQQCNALAVQFRVRDVVPSSATVLFLLESPHVQELKYGAPVCGASGAAMTRHLFGEEYGHLPLGILVGQKSEQRILDLPIQRVGLMNVCPIPMQRIAYGNSALADAHVQLLSILGNLRTAGGSPTYRDQDWSTVQEILVESLQKRLQALSNRPLLIVPCGRFAQKFFKLADVSSKQWTVLPDVPHPSYNNWSKPAYQSVITRLQRLFQQETENVSREH